ncbi:MAG TPA: acyl-CoA dehydrogenase family protein [Actinomycetota bacterium]|nr:acyl-CoA dehydrogenase family protein [Actinomycetota bacterium]
MDYALDPEHIEFRKVVRSFAETVIAPHSADFDERAEFPTDLVLQCGRQGFLGLPIPEEYGGAGADYISYLLCVEELARIDPSIAITVEAHTSLVCNLLFHFGDENQKKTWLTPLAQGGKIGAFGLTEPGAGSDAGGTRTTARRTDGGYVINGSKIFITNAGTDISLLTICTARTEDGEISAFIVPNGTPGFEVGRKLRKLGWHASDTRELAFTDCFVPEENLLGEPGRGFRQFLAQLDDGRIAISALAVGQSQGCLDECLSYVRERKQFGKSIGEFQAIQFKLADMATKIHHARLAVYHAGRLRQDGKPYKQEASMVKLFSTEMAVDIAREAVQVHGGYGFIEEFPVARFYRDAKVLEIGEGTSEVQRMIIARQLGMDPGTRPRGA